ncbi:MAG: AsmA family protein, partial [Vicinamibacterales bacterium]
MKKIAIGAIVLFVGLSVALAVLARAVLTGDRVRAAIAAQVSAAIGQPVTIGSIGASIYPRVTMDLTDVAIGQPASVQLQSMHVGTDLGALFSRRIERAAIRVDGARITMPLPDFGAGGRAAGQPTAGTQGAGDSRPPVEIVSIDEIVLRGVEVVRGNRT